MSNGTFHPTHLTAKGELVDSIEYYNNELTKLNEHISTVITKIDSAKDKERRKFLMKMGESTTTIQSGIGSQNEGNSSSLGLSGHLSGTGNSNRSVLHTLEEDKEERESLNIEGGDDENATLHTKVTQDDTLLVRQTSKNSGLTLDRHQQYTNSRRRSHESVEGLVVSSPTKTHEVDHFRDISELPTDLSEDYDSNNDGIITQQQQYQKPLLQLDNNHNNTEPKLTSSFMDKAPQSNDPYHISLSETPPEIISHGSADSQQHDVDNEEEEEFVFHSTTATDGNENSNHNGTNQNEQEIDTTNTTVRGSGLNLADFQNDPFCQLFFADITHHGNNLVVTGTEILSDKSKHNDNDGKTEIARRLSFISVEDDGVSSVYVASSDAGKDGDSEGDSDGDDSSSVFVPINTNRNDCTSTSTSPPTYMPIQNSTMEESNTPNTNTNTITNARRLPRRTLFAMNSSNEKEEETFPLHILDEEGKDNTFEILDEEAKNAFLLDLRKHLRRDPSSRSLLSDTSESVDVKIIVDKSLLSDGGDNSSDIRQIHDLNGLALGGLGLGLNLDTDRSTIPHINSFTSFGTKDSSSSPHQNSCNRSSKKISVKKSLLKTADGMKKSANVMQDSVKKSANIVQDSVKKSVFVVQHGMKKTVYVVQDGAKKSASAVHGKIKNSVTDFVKIGQKSVKLATNLLRGMEDGKVRDGGFVTFTTLTAKAQCVQMLHAETPFTFKVTDAPLPKDVYWNNVGLSHKKQQLGFVIAQLLTIGLCLFWTFPVAFVSSFSEVDSLKRTIPSLEKAIEKNPWIEPLLRQLSPILIVILKMLLPVILSKFCEREGHISRTNLNASLLTKLAAFLVRETDRETQIRRDKEREPLWKYPMDFFFSIAFYDSHLFTLLYYIRTDCSNFFRSCSIRFHLCPITQNH